MLHSFPLVYIIIRLQRTANFYLKLYAALPQIEYEIYNVDYMYLHSPLSYTYMYFLMELSSLLTNSDHQIQVLVTTLLVCQAYTI